MQLFIGHGVQPAEATFNRTRTPLPEDPSRRSAMQPASGRPI